MRAKEGKKHQNDHYEVYKFQRGNPTHPTKIDTSPHPHGKKNMDIP